MKKRRANQDSLDAGWEAQRRRLERFRARFGHLLVPRFWKEDRALGVWAANQQQKMQLGKLRPDRAEKLRAMGFATNRLEQIWNSTFRQLAAFRREHGHLRVPRQSSLDQWIKGQRTSKRAGRLSKERARLLNTLGFDWGLTGTTHPDLRWEERFFELQTYARKHGHCNVPVDFPNQALATWVRTQRRYALRGKLTQARQARLTDLGFRWSSLRDVSHERLTELAEFRRKNGHVDVPEGGKLGNWVRTQRKGQRKGVLPPAVVLQLNALGFTWNPRSRDREDMISRVREFRLRQGHFAFDPKTDQQLYWWATHQRVERKKGNLSRVVIQELTAMGFPWFADELRWEFWYSRLKVFIVRNGHLRVPEATALGRWLAEQREALRAGTLSADEEARLRDPAALVPRATDRARGTATRPR